MEIETNKKSVMLLKVLITLLFASILLPTNIKTIAVVFFACIIVSTISYKKFVFRKVYFLYSTLFFFVLILTFLYSDNKTYALRKVTSMSSLVIFPFLFSLLTKDITSIVKSWKSLLLKAYIFSVFSFNILPFLYLWFTNYTFSEMIIHYATIVRVDFGKFGIHPIYLSMHTSLAILFSFFVILKATSKRLVTLILAIDIMLISFLLLYAKKGPLIALCLILFLALFFKRRDKFFKPFLISIIVLVGLTIAVPKTRNNFVELFKMENVQDSTINSTNIRYAIYESAIEVISEAPLLGYGIGDYNDVLYEQYKVEGSEVLMEGKYNAHNQYLSFLIMGGLVVFVLFVFYLLFSIVLGIRFDNRLLILTIIFYGVVMFTENILERESGVLYFSLFTSYFSLFNSKE